MFVLIETYSADLRLDFITFIKSIKFKQWAGHCLSFGLTFFSEKNYFSIPFKNIICQSLLFHIHRNQNSIHPCVMSNVFFQLDVI